MKTTKKIQVLRAEQKAELVKVNNRLAEIEKATMKFYKETPYKVREQMGHDEVAKICCWREERELNKRKEYLEKEIIEVKYANECLYSDVKPYEVLEEKTPDCYIIRAMSYTETEASIKARQASFVPGGFIGHFDNDVQAWDIKPNPNGLVLRVRRHKDGYFYSGGIRFFISDKPVRHYDFNF